jgi:Flp pilus assembly protein TadD
LLAALCSWLAGCSSAPSPLERDLQLDKLASDIERRGDPATASALYARAAQQQQDAPAFIRLGNARLGSGDANGAVLAFRQALMKEPHNPDALLGFGTAQLRLGNASSAANALKDAAPLRKTASTYSKLGTAYSLLGQTSAAETAFSQALQLEPGNLDIQSNQAMALALGGSPDRAVTLLRTIIRSPLAMPGHYRNLLLALVLAGQDQEAADLIIPQTNPTQKSRLLDQARTIKSLRDSIQRAQAVGLITAHSH